MQIALGTGLARWTSSKLRLTNLPPRRGQQTAAPKKVELFINDKRILVDPGTTIMQVCVEVFAMSLCAYFDISK